MCLKELLEQIASVDSTGLTQIVQAVLARYRDLFPEEDVIFLSFPKKTGMHASHCCAMWLT